MRRLEHTWIKQKKIQYSWIFNIDSEAVANQEIKEFINIYPKASQEMPQSYKTIPKFFTPVREMHPFRQFIFK